MAAAASSSSRKQKSRRSNTTLMVLTYDDHAVLAVESRITKPLFDEVDPREYKKFLKPYPNSYIYLGFCGSVECILKLEARLPKWCTGRTPPKNLKEAMREIRQFINDKYATKWAQKRVDVDIVVVGAVKPDEPFRMYLMTKRADNRYKSKRVSGRKICIGSGSKVLNGDYLDAFQEDLNAEQSCCERRLGEWRSDKFD